jgi:hypothetical protein
VPSFGKRRNIKHGEALVYTPVSGFLPYDDHSNHGVA